MMPHIYNSRRRYPGQWVQSLEGGPNLMGMDLLECMDCTFGDMHKYNTMIHSLYEIRQKKGGICGGVHVVNPRGCCCYSSCLPGPSHRSRKESGAG